MTCRVESPSFWYRIKTRFLLSSIGLWFYCQYLRLRYKTIFHKDHTWTVYDRIKREHSKSRGGRWM